MNLTSVILNLSAAHFLYHTWPAVYLDCSKNNLQPGDGEFDFRHHSVNETHFDVQKILELEII